MSAVKERCCSFIAGRLNSNISTFRMKKIILGLVVLLYLAYPVSIVADGRHLSSDELLELLDEELTHRNAYMSRRQQQIDSVKGLISADSTQAVKHYFALGELIGGLNADSAIVAFSRGYDAAMAAGDSVSAQRYLICRATELRNLSSTPEAMRDLIHISRFGIYPENEGLYYEVSRDLYYTMAEVFEGTATYDNYIRPGLDFARKYQSTLDPDSYEAKLNIAMVYYAQGNDAMFLASLTELANEIPESDPHYSMVQTAIGGRYALIGRPEDGIPYLIKAALNELRAGNRQGTALIRLGSALYDVNDFVRAHNYLSIALEEAIAGSAKTNSMMISSAMMPVSNKMRSQEQLRMALLIGLVVSLLVAVLLLWRLYSGKKRRAIELEKVKQQLAVANMSKEAYIADFMNLSSSFMEGLEEFNRICKRKITAGQIDELLNMIKGGKFLEEQRGKFDDIFDDSFLALYPTFIDDVNKLLLPDKQIVTPSRNVLSTELRVLAFTRLGVDDTARVARFLGVTLNTIYTYRNKLRNKAVSRETFDADVMKIGVID